MEEKCYACCEYVAGAVALACIAIWGGVMARQMARRNRTIRIHDAKSGGKHAEDERRSGGN